MDSFPYEKRKTLVGSYTLDLKEGSYKKEKVFF